MVMRLLRTLLETLQRHSSKNSKLGRVIAQKILVGLIALRIGKGLNYQDQKIIIAAQNIGMGGHFIFPKITLMSTQPKLL